MKYRMYFFVPYSLSPIQKGIQAGHAALEYASTYGDTAQYQSFIANDKTWILLDGGTSRWGFMDVEFGSGGMNEIFSQLSDNNIPFEYFTEPDINFALTAVCFLADERVWDFENYPDFMDGYNFEYARNLLGSKITPEYLEKTRPEDYQKWVESIGGEKNVFLRELIRCKKLAN